jgi:Flp pilus assembly protein TadD
MILAVILVMGWEKKTDLGQRLPGFESSQTASEGGKSQPGSQPEVKYMEPAPSKSPVDPGASDRFNEEGLKQAQAGKLAEGAELFSKAVKANPNNAVAWNNLGLALRKMGNTQEAVKAYRRAIKAQTGFALAYKNLGIALEQAADKAGAVQAYQKYLELDPAASDVNVVKERVEKLKGNR